jgi:hypothetical protein
MDFSQRTLEMAGPKWNESCPPVKQRRNKTMNLIPLFAIWAVFGVAVLGLALYRKILTFHGDDEYLHLADSEQRLIPQQVTLGNKLDVIDRWGKGLTVFTVAYGILIAGMFIYQAWQSSFALK